MSEISFDSLVLQTWATHFALPVETLSKPGSSLFINPRRGEDSYLILWPVGEHVVAEIAPHRAEMMRGLLARLPAGHRLTAADFTPDDLDFTLEINWNYALDPATFRPFTAPEGYTVRQLTHDDDAAFEAFAAQTTEDERDEGEVSIDHLAAFGVFTPDGQIGAVASSFEYKGFTDLGILTAEPFRGRGLAKAAVSAIAQHHLNEPRLVGYRHDDVNQKSRRIAESLGFVNIGRVEALEPKNAKALFEE